MIVRSSFPALAVGLALLGLAGCGPVGPATPGTQGELGNGQFSYACDSDSDPVCDSAPGGHAMPKSVAVGSRFSASYTPSSSSEENQGSATVMPASEELLVATETFGSSFKALKPGLAGLIARRGQTLVDLIHVRLSNADHVQVDVTTDPPKEKISKLEIPLGESVQIRGMAVDEADEMLAGALSCTWTIADVKVASMTTLSTDNQITIEALAAGATTLHLELGEMTADIALSVGEGSGGAGGVGGGGGSGGGGIGGAAGGGGQ